MTDPMRPVVAAEARYVPPPFDIIGLGMIEVAIPQDDGTTRTVKIRPHRDGTICVNAAALADLPAGAFADGMLVVGAHRYRPVRFTEGGRVVVCAPVIDPDAPGHVATVWPERQRVAVVHSTTADLVVDDHLDIIERDLQAELLQVLVKRGLTLATATGPVWSWYPWGYEDARLPVEDEPQHRWRRGEPVPDAAGRLVCRVSGWAVPPLQEEDEQRG